MSEQMADQTSGESGSLKAGLGSLETPSTPFAVAAMESMPETTNVDSPKLSPEQGGPGETRKVDTAKADAPKADAPKAETRKPDAPKADVRRMPGSITIMSANGRAGAGGDSWRTRRRTGDRGCRAFSWRWRHGVSQSHARSVGCADRCRHPDADGQPRKYLQNRHGPVQQNQRSPRQGREGASRTGCQTRQAQRGRR